MGAPNICRYFNTGAWNRKLHHMVCITVVTARKEKSVRTSYVPATAANAVSERGISRIRPNSRDRVTTLIYSRRQRSHRESYERRYRAGYPRFDDTRIENNARRIKLLIEKSKSRKSECKKLPSIGFAFYRNIIERL